jgi:hypothetical protein
MGREVKAGTFSAFSSLTTAAAKNTAVTSARSERCALSNAFLGDRLRRLARTILRTLSNQEPLTLLALGLAVLDQQQFQLASLLLA